MSKISRDDIAANSEVMSLWAIVVGRLLGRHMVCVCCGVRTEEDAEHIMNILRDLGFGEAVARAQRDFVERMDQARREGRWSGSPYVLPAITNDGFLLRYLLEDAEQVFNKGKQP